MVVPGANGTRTMMVELDHPRQLGWPGPPTPIQSGLPIISAENGEDAPTERIRYCPGPGPVITNPTIAEPPPPAGSRLGESAEKGTMQDDGAQKRPCSTA